MSRGMGPETLEGNKGSQRGRRVEMRSVALVAGLYSSCINSPGPVLIGGRYIYTDAQNLS